MDVTLSAPVGPAITSFTPAKGPVEITVRINGTNLAGATQVMFGGVPASITFNTTTQITTSVPAGAATGPIAVTTAAGTGTTTDP